MTKNKYDSKFKLQVVLETLNPNTTVESIKMRNNTIVVKYLQRSLLSL